jgi:hypothetical protein
MCRRRDDGEIVDSPEVAIDIVKFCLSDWECKGLDGGEVAGAYARSTAETFEWTKNLST